MRVEELWRYPVKSMAGERIEHARVTRMGVPGDRRILVLGANGHVITSRTHHQLLGLKGTLGDDGKARISGHPWDSPEALALTREAVGEEVQLIEYEGAERFDILPLLVATDGSIAAFGHDGRRLRPNIVVSGVEGLAERTWPGKTLAIGEARIGMRDLRSRCVMTTYDPDTLEQDSNILKEIVRKFYGTLALNCFVIKEGEIKVGDTVSLGEVASVKGS
jgi:MOSC domain-containing protein